MGVKHVTLEVRLSVAYQHDRCKLVQRSKSQIQRYARYAFFNHKYNRSFQRAYVFHINVHAENKAAFYCTPNTYLFSDLLIPQPRHKPVLSQTGNIPSMQSWEVRWPSYANDAGHWLQLPGCFLRKVGILWPGRFNWFFDMKGGTSYFDPLLGKEDMWIFKHLKQSKNTQFTWHVHE